MEEFTNLPPELIEGFQKLVSGDFSYRLPRSFKRDEQDAVAFFFNTIAAELDRIIADVQTNEHRLNQAVAAISAALIEVASGNLQVEIERDYRGDQIDILTYLVNTTISEIAHFVAEDQRRNAEIQSRLETAVEERTRQLYQSEQNFRLLFESAPTPVMLVDLAQKIILMANQAASALLGVAAEHLTGRPLPDFFQDPADRQRFWANFDDGSSLQDFVLPIYTGDRAAIWILMNTRPVTFAGQPALMISLADLTQEKEATLALEAAYRRELEIAHQIQASLLPGDLPSIPGLDVAAFFRPAQQVGGDLYSCFVFDPGHVSVAIGDASGKGLQAALMMSLSVGIVTSHVRRDLEPASLLAMMNPKVWSHTQRNKVNLAFCYLTLAKTGSGWSMSVANAGAIAPLLIRRSDRTYSWLDVGGLPLGMAVDVHYPEHQQLLAPGDAVILCSDGVIEAMNAAREMYGFERFLARVQTAPLGSARETARWILAGAQDFVGQAEQHDDMTLVILIAGP